ITGKHSQARKKTTVITDEVSVKNADVPKPRRIEVIFQALGQPIGNISAWTANYYLAYRLR
ncbi:MAG: hypothetical protein ABIP88_04220, partial [Candidatus Binatia bacterium]